MKPNMFRRILCSFIVIFLESSTVKSLDVNCLSYNFERNFEELFSHDHLACKHIAGVWTSKQYHSNNVITPGEDLSCLSSKEFPISSGELQVKLYVDSNVTDYLLIQLLKDETSIAEKSFDLTDIHGWSNVGLEIHVANNDIVNSKISFIGQAASTSQLFIKEFRYVPYHSSGLKQACLRWVTVSVSKNQLEISEPPEAAELLIESDSLDESRYSEAFESEIEYDSQDGSGSPEGPESEIESSSQDESGSPEAPESEIGSNSQDESGSPEGPESEIESGSQDESSSAEAPESEIVSNSQDESDSPEGPESEIESGSQDESGSPEAPESEIESGSQDESGSPEGPESEIESGSQDESGSPEGPESEIESGSQDESGSSEGPESETESGSQDESGSPEGPESEIESGSQDESGSPEAPESEIESDSQDESGSPEGPESEIESGSQDESGSPEGPESEIESGSQDVSGSPEGPESEIESGSQDESGSPEAPESEIESDSQDESGSPEGPESEIESDSQDESASPESSESENCFIYNFESDFEEIFVNDSPACSFQNGLWTLGHYDSIDINPQHELSKIYVTPSTESSCISSIPINIRTGIIALNIYVNYRMGDHLIVQVFISESETLVASTLIPLEDINGWTTVPIELQVTESNSNYGTARVTIVFIGAATASSDLLLDSFRYIPQGLNDNEVDDICPIYEESGSPEGPESEIESSSQDESGSPEAPESEIESDSQDESGSPEVPESEIESGSQDESGSPESPESEIESGSQDESGSPEAPESENESDSQDESGSPEAPESEIESDSHDESGSPEGPESEIESGSQDESGSPEGPESEIESGSQDESGSPEGPESEIESGSQDESGSSEGPESEIESGSQDESGSPEGPESEIESGSQDESGSPEAPESEIESDSQDESGSPEGPESEIESGSQDESGSPEGPESEIESDSQDESGSPEGPESEIESDSQDESASQESSESENCFIYNFEKDFEEIFVNDSPACSFQNGLWTLGHYDSIDINPQHELSKIFVTPSRESSCISSIPINIRTGIIALNIFVNYRMGDHLIVQVFISESETPVASTLIPLEDINGWTTVPIELQVTESNSNYGTIVFIGAATASSHLLLDSFRYIPQGINDDEVDDICPIYEESGSPEGPESEIESESQDESDSLEGPESENCFVFNFETDFENIFVNDSPACSFQNGLWTLGHYDSIDINPQHELSKIFVTPSTESSCISSIPINITTGIIALNIYVNYRMGDHLIVQVFISESETPVASTLIPLEDINGWTTVPIEIQVTESNSNYGTVVIIGAATASSHLLLDSFRYIPQGLDDNDVDDICPIYEDAVQPPTAECMTYNFESDLSETFDNVACTTANGYSEWIIGDFSSIDVDAPHVHSTTFISPTASPSCTSTVSISLSSGILEVNIYVNYQDGDSLAILVVHDTIIVSIEEVDLANSNGWITLSIQVQIPNNNVENCNIVFLGVSSVSSVLLIDSFRYLPHDIEENETEHCSIYPDDETNPPGEILSFWNPVSIAAIAVVSVIACALIGGLVFYFVKSTATVTTSMANLIEQDVEAPVNVRLPRVANIY